MLPALLLCAGLGTRLRPLSSVRAKPAVPVAGEPLVRRILRWLSANGVDDVVLNLHHLPEMLEALRLPCLAERELSYLFAEHNLLSTEQLRSIVADLGLDRDYLMRRLSDNRRPLSL